MQNPNPLLHKTASSSQVDYKILKANLTYHINSMLPPSPQRFPWVHGLL